MLYERKHILLGCAAGVTTNQVEAVVSHQTPKVFRKFTFFCPVEKRFVAMIANTPNAVNASPKVGPIVITEIMYHPQTNADAEYVELKNISGSAVTLYDGVTGAGWRFVDDKNNIGIEYHFPTVSPITLAAGEYLLLIKDQASFETEFLGAFAKDKEHGVNDVGFSRSVGSHDGGEAFVEGADCFDSSVGFEVFEYHFGDH